MTGELVPSFPSHLVHPGTGELLPATPAYAIDVIVAAREIRARLLNLIKDAEAVLVEESSRVGKKTLRVEGVRVEVTGGSEVVWDVEKLRAGLEAAGCPQERLDELVTAHVEFRVNQSVARQLASANQTYAQVIAMAKGRVEKPFRASVKEAR